MTDDTGNEHGKRERKREAKLLTDRMGFYFFLAGWYFTMLETSAVSEIAKGGGSVGENVAPWMSRTWLGER